jgi:hypothetical protein
MRAIGVVGSVFALGMFLYAATSFMAVSAAIQPKAAKPAAKALPLEEAAPEVAVLRPHFREVALKALEAAPMCVKRHEESEPARPRGSVLIWDVEKADVSEAHGRLPVEMRLQKGDAACTVFLITERERRAVMNYNYDVFHGNGSAGVQGFRTDLFVCAVDLPTLQPRGRYRINGNGPPQLVTLEPGVREIDEDWAGNLGRWVQTCVHGPEARYYAPYQQPMARKADEARGVIDQCEMLGSLPRLPNLPNAAVVWNPQTDRWHPGHGPLRHKGDGQEKSLLLVMVLDDMLITERGTGRIDYRVALVSFPGANPLGVYQVRGEAWPLPQNGRNNWSPEDPNARDPARALAAWVDRLCESPRGLPQGTLTLAPDATQLAGTPWLKGPGWLKRLKTGETPEEQKGWEQMAEECSAAVARCRAKGSAAPSGKLPGKVVVWVDYAEAFGWSPAQNALPKALQAKPKDRDVLMAMIVGSDYVTEPRDKPKTERFDHEIALFTMPGAQPVGVYHVRGETLPFDRDRHSPNAKNADTGRDIAEWLRRFLESPGAVARNSAVR